MAWTTSYYHYDGLGSTRQLTDSSENVTDTYLYDAWGESLLDPDPTPNPFQWVGKEGYYFDVKASRYYVRARTYDAATGRWLSLDPLFYPRTDERFVTKALHGYDDGINLYEYVGNRPAFSTDPSGLFLGFNYGNFCGYSKKASCPPGTGPLRPIDALDAACEKHDCCLATFWECINPWLQLKCNFLFCGEINDAYESGCAKSYPADKEKQKKCENAAYFIRSLCLIRDQPISGP